jgi:hypothetical protein
MWIVNGNTHSKYNNPHSQNKAGILFSLFPIGRQLHFSLRIRIAENRLTSSFTIHIMKVLRQSPIHVHDVAGKFAIYYPHHEGA